VERWVGHRKRIADLLREVAHPKSAKTECDLSDCFAATTRPARVPGHSPGRLVLTGRPADVAPQELVLRSSGTARNHQIRGYRQETGVPTDSKTKLTQFHQHNCCHSDRRRRARQSGALLPGIAIQMSENQPAIASGNDCLSIEIMTKGNR
jgi:hypothetical protein